MFPKIERPCPYIDRLGEVMDGDFCRMCRRTVFDLSAMDEAERRVFMRGCGGEEVCVRYRVRPALVAAALAASVAALPAAAQDATAPQTAPAPAGATTTADATEDLNDEIVVGGARIIDADEEDPVIVFEGAGASSSQMLPLDRTPRPPRRRKGDPAS